MPLEWNVKDINIHTSRMLDELINLANLDNLITEEEDMIIEACREKIWALQNEFTQMVENNLDLPSVRSKVKSMLKNIIHTAAEAARADGKITSDELYLVDRLNKYIRDNDFSKIIK